MNKKRKLGLGIGCAGLGLSLSKFSFITGFAIVDKVTAHFNWIQAIGIGMIIGGAILITRKDELEEILGDDAEPLKKEIKEMIKGKKGEPSRERKEVYGEIHSVISGKYEEGRPHMYPSNRAPLLHLPTGTSIITRDAATLNDAMNFSRSGIYRHVFDKSNGNYLGIAQHYANENSLKWVYRLKKPVKVKK